MLILIALVPGQSTVNPAFDAAKIEKTLVLIESGRDVLAKPAFAGNNKAEAAAERLEKVDHIPEETKSLSTLPHAEQETLRVEILKAASAIRRLRRMRMHLVITGGSSRTPNTVFRAQSSLSPYG
jgi:hypothetical protein